MKAVSINLPRELQYIDIHVFSDWHLGDPQCKLNDIKSTIAAIAENPKAYVVVNGDLINNAVRNGVSDIYSERLNPMEELELAYELLEPIKDRILAITSGNHENRSNKECGVDLTAFLATKLGLLDRYDPISVALYIRLGELKKKATGHPDRTRQVCYKIYLTHGSGGGRTEGSKINSLVRLQSIIDADVYVHSHTHQGAVLKGVRLKMDDRNNTIKEEELLFVNSAAQLAFGGYGERLAFKPASTKQPTIRLSGVKKEFTASL